MPKYIAALTIALMLGTVLSRVLMMKRAGIQAMNFGKIDKTDFLIPPFALFYFYLVFANTFNLPTITRQEIFNAAPISWVGVVFCLAGLLVLLWSLVSFGESFRIGIDIDNPDKLVTTGVFSFSRNPIYVAFGMILLGQFLIFSDQILLIYLLAGILLFHRQVLREEEYLKKYYGSEFSDYCQRVRRYF